MAKALAVVMVALAAILWGAGPAPVSVAALMVLVVTGIGILLASALLGPRRRGGEESPSGPGREGPRQRGHQDQAREPGRRRVPRHLRRGGRAVCHDHLPGMLAETDPHAAAIALDLAHIRVEDDLPDAPIGEERRHRLVQRGEDLGGEPRGKYLPMFGM